MTRLGVRAMRAEEGHGQTVDPWASFRTRLLAAGTEIDPSSLALSVGGSNIGQGSRTAPGSTLYWTQGGQPMSASLN